ncbi:uncharacterized protein si:ch211-145o7.3 isoform X2 [Phycodurus eques]|uniref:uncharacterized protein si:ch211-145o7.3 isoform X2 n=1 Tax=Phycodurus eques TaxID=693459 RepID=UPI002ACED81F|nr:uncharacterized protein si:ch211-145o7.3 isoform X2 [Phycodurus eques]
MATRTTSRHAHGISLPSFGASKATLIPDQDEASRAARWLNDGEPVPHPSALVSMCHRFRRALLALLSHDLPSPLAHLLPSIPDHGRVAPVLLIFLLVLLLSSFQLSGIAAPRGRPDVPQLAAPTRQPPLAPAAPQSAAASASSRVRTGSRLGQAAVLLQQPDIHGHRGVGGQEAAGEGHLRLDRGQVPLLQDGQCGMEELGEAQSVLEQELLPHGEEQKSDCLPHSLMLSAPSPHTPSPDNPTFADHPDFPLTPDHEELVAIEPLEYQAEDLGGDLDKDPLADCGYIELHYYQSPEYQYLVLPDDTGLDLETVEILQLDTEAQEAAGSLLDLAGRGY